MSDPGIPDGWVAEEEPGLRFGVWRFYAIVDLAQESSVSEDNWVTRDGVPMPGEQGLRAYLHDVQPLSDPDRVPPALMAAHVGHFLIRGSSRDSSAIRVVDDHEHGAEPPSSAIEDGRFVFRVWYQRGGYRIPVQVTQDGDGNVSVAWGDIVVGR